MLSMNHWRVSGALDIIIGVMIIGVTILSIFLNNIELLNTSPNHGKSIIINFDDHFFISLATVSIFVCFGGWLVVRGISQVLDREINFSVMCRWLGLCLRWLVVRKSAWRRESKNT